MHTHTSPFVSNIISEKINHLARDKFTGDETLWLPVTDNIK